MHASQPFSRQILCYAWFSLIAIFINTGGDKEFRVVVPKSCNATYCTGINRVTLKHGQPCDGNDQHQICIECSYARCVFYEYKPWHGHEAYYTLNFAALFLMLNFLRTVWQVHIASAFVLWYWELGRSPADTLRKSVRCTLNRLGVACKGSVLIPLFYLPNYFFDRIYEWRSRNKRSGRVKALTVVVTKPLMFLYDQ
jgi:hypothetical protein